MKWREHFALLSVILRIAARIRNEDSSNGQESGSGAPRSRSARLF
ncbi:Hypothetical protein CAP_4093 [Chondromyces apiculatus DSM 436]|uniref:Uncharacterized protein n=1 Tax=Chondromyces apiculatus DSM 436 TaxID=1192034 RepID=A0A017TH32_9BACT|nr:Hypothetical protein CAP_4093 [Chondromyces apiculatus DSM 436]